MIGYCQNCQCQRGFSEACVADDINGTLTCGYCGHKELRSKIMVKENKPLFYCVGENAKTTLAIGCGSTLEEALRVWAGDCTNEEFVEQVTEYRPTVIEGTVRMYKLAFSVEVDPD